MGHSKWDEEKARCVRDGVSGGLSGAQGLSVFDTHRTGGVGWGGGRSGVRGAGCGSVGEGTVAGVGGPHCPSKLSPDSKYMYKIITWKIGGNSCTRIKYSPRSQLE